jgi:putative transposase
MIDFSDCALTLKKQCELLGLARSSFYYEPVAESELNLRLMRMIDEEYLKTPFYGSRKMVIELEKKGEIVNRKRVQRLMRIMGLEAMYPKPRTSIGNKDHYKHPYLLKDLKIFAPNQVWGTDITYVPLESGFLYLVAILDLFSRYVVSWAVSESLESDFCIDAVKTALKKGEKPQILNSDQGTQYTSKAYTDLLKINGIAVSMSGKGRCWDNIFVERLWRSYKYEEVYLKNYSSGKEMREGSDCYFNFYNDHRPHQRLGYSTPKEIYYGNLGEK